MLQKIILGICVYTLLLFVIVKRGGSVDFLPLIITQGNTVSQLGLYIGLWALLWVVYNVLRPVVKMFTLPINRLTLGLAHILLNIAFIYIFPHVVALFPREVQIAVGSFIEVIVLCIILWLVWLML